MTLADECRERATYLKAMEPEGLSTIERQSMETLFKAADALHAIEAAIQQTREECARVAESYGDKPPSSGPFHDYGKGIAAAIRALGND